MKRHLYPRPMGLGLAISAFFAIPVFATDPCPSNVSAGVTACYFIANGGSDSAAGTKAAPWAHLPRMRTWTGSHTPVAGEGFILSGGDTWTSEDLGFQWIVSGTSSNRIYIGVDPSWYSGGSWARPIFTCLNSSGVQHDCYTDSGQQNMIQLWSSYVTIDNVEFTHLYIGAYHSVSAVSLTHLGSEVKNSYCHGWGHDPTLDPAHTPAPGVVTCFSTYLGSGSDAVIGSSIHDNVVDGSDTVGDDGVGVQNAQYIYNNVIRYVFNGINGQSDYIYNNLVEHVDFWAFDGAHCNEFYHKGPINTTLKTVYIHDNVTRNNSALGCVVFFVQQTNCPTCTAYVYNNDLPLTTGSNPIFATGQLSPFGTIYFYNNTVAAGSNRSCMGNGLGAPLLGTVVFDNNHCITETGAITCTDGGHNLKQTSAQAAAHYNSASATYAYSPKDASAQGIAAGANLTSLVGTDGTSGSDTTFAVGYDAVNHKVITAQRTAVARPTSAAWDVGAYQYSSPSLPQPPTNLAVTVH
jgi:hypothetical protein